ncbi:MAG: hypothetical protein MUD06_14410 [Rhodospirillales bacterium]|jgi:hypothetical protein|nr:hypothetical protein [Rhodospirillales bacterium]
MSPRSRFAAAAGLLAAASLSGCELTLHEVQRAGAEGCDPWQAGCAAPVGRGEGEPTQPSRADLDRLAIVSQAVEARYRRCDGVGLACQARIIGDVLWDQYVMVLAGRPEATSALANADSLPPEGLDADRAAPAAAAADAAAAPQPGEAHGRVVRTHGSRSAEPATPASR